MTTKSAPTRKIRVLASYIAMLAPFVSREETRYYLNGIYIAPHPKGGVWMAATDGHRMGLVYDENGSTDGDYICAVPTDVVKACARHPRQMFERPGLCHFVGDNVYVTNIAWSENCDKLDPTDFGKHHLSVAHAPAIDGTYPDILRVIPDMPSPQARSKAARQAAWFNPNYLKAFQSVGKHGPFSDSNAAVTIVTKSVEDPALVFVANVPEFLGVLMPMRGDTNHATPNWLTTMIDAKDGKATPKNTNAKVKAKAKTRIRKKPTPSKRKKAA